MDRGFYHFNFWLQLIEKKVDFITRIKKGAAIKVDQVFTDSYGIRDRRIRLGSGTDKTPFITLRLVEVRSGKTWHSYLLEFRPKCFTPLCGGRFISEKMAN